MIGFNELGKHGRLGNQMFQYASLKGIASKHNYTWCIPPSNFNNPNYDHQLFEVFNLNSLKHIEYVPDTYPLITESSFYFDDRLFSDCPDNVDLGGFFQSEKYFNHIKTEILEDFTFKEKILNTCKNIMDRLGKRISLHVRRKDCLVNNNFLGIKYYSEALSHFDSSEKVMVFSDDTTWCRNQSLFQSDRFFISPFKTNLIDLCLMTLCSKHIIANSSFSWWGAWLANSEKVISPSRWFGEDKDGNKWGTKDVIPDTWIKI